MKYIIHASFVCACLLLIALTPVYKVPVEVPVKNYILTELSALREQLQAIQKTSNIEVIKEAYFKARRHYKHIEFFIEQVSPHEAKYSINGPLVPKYDPDWPGNSYLQGFQRIEELLFAEEVHDQKLIKEMSDRLTKQMDLLIRYYTSFRILPSDVLEMLQLQLFRMVALNLNGYDATFVKNNVQECRWNLEGMESVLVYYEQRSSKKASYVSLMHHIKQTKKHLQKHTNYDSFNRLAFITAYINPLNEAMVNFHEACGYPWNGRKQALNLRTGFLFGKESFNASFFSMYYEDTLLVDQQAELGKMLFFDPLLSGNNSRSCATCHMPDKGFSDGRKRGLDIGGQGTFLRNTPSLWNVMYQQAFFWDGRVGQLEQQVFDVIHSKHEMNATLESIVSKLKSSEEYSALFKQAFKNTPDSILTEYAVQKALTEFEKTLVVFNSPFDQYLKGNKTALTTRAINGYTVFAGKALCGSCHFFPLFNGTVPPAFTDTEYEVIGTPASIEQNELDEDIGRYNVFKIDDFRHAFKTPGLRNLSTTAPYMHNGAYATLEEVVEFYHAGGGKGLGFEVQNQTLPFDSLQLSASEKEDVILFLKALNDTTVHIVAPDELPALNKGGRRKVNSAYK